MFRCGPYVSSMSLLDSSRFHWQRCRSSSHSVLDRRPRRNNCSTCNRDGEKSKFRQEGRQVVLLLSIFLLGSDSVLQLCMSTTRPHSRRSIYTFPAHSTTLSSATLQEFNSLHLPSRSGEKAFRSFTRTKTML